MFHFTFAAGVLPPVQAVPPLLLAQPGPVPRQVPLRPGGRRQAGLEADQGAPHQHQGIREALGCQDVQLRESLFSCGAAVELVILYKNTSVRDEKTPVVKSGTFKMAPPKGRQCRVCLWDVFYNRVH